MAFVVSFFNWLFGIKTKTVEEIVKEKTHVEKLEELLYALRQLKNDQYVPITGMLTSLKCPVTRLGHLINIVNDYYNAVLTDRLILPITANNYFDITVDDFLLTKDNCYQDIEFILEVFVMTIEKLLSLENQISTIDNNPESFNSRCTVELIGVLITISTKLLACFDVE